MQITTEFIHELLPTLKKASAEILRIYETDFGVQFKADHSPVTQADKMSSEIISTFLRTTGIPVISEEEQIPDFETRQKESFVWLLDPLDGTKEFIRKNGEFCINLALVKNGEPHFGIIVDPVRNQVLFGGDEIPAHLAPMTSTNLLVEDNRVSRSRHQKKRGLIFSRSHFSPEINELVQRIQERYGNLELLKKGSALKFIDLVRGEADFYPRSGPTMEWDIAAGHAIYRSVGGDVLNLRNFEPLRYNKKELINPGFIAKPVSLNIH